MKPRVILQCQKLHRSLLAEFMVSFLKVMTSMRKTRITRHELLTTSTGHLHV